MVGTRSSPPVAGAAVEGEGGRAGEGEGEGEGFLWFGECEPTEEREAFFFFFFLIFFAFSCNVADATSVRKQNSGKPSGSLAFLEKIIMFFFFLT
jgi:hypothetical protein